jgi:predicted phosphodiesterase
MKLAVFADIHGNLQAFEAALADFATVGDVDKIWFLGDLAAVGPQPSACIAKIRALIDQHGKDKCQVIGGNTDRYLVTGKRPEFPIVKEAEKFGAHIDAIVSLGEVFSWNARQLTWEDYALLSNILGRELHWRVADYGDVIGFHAIPGDDEPMSLRPNTPDEEAHDALLDREGRLAIAGHTHLRMDRQLGNWRVINPGSVGLSFSQSGMAEWALLTVENGDLHLDWRAVPFDIEATLADARSVGHPHIGLLEKRLRAQV